LTLVATEIAPAPLGKRGKLYLPISPTNRGDGPPSRGKQKKARLTMKELLSCLDKRDLLNKPSASVESLVDWGQGYLEAGFVYDAVDFFEKAGAQEPLRKLLELAQVEGDVFLLRRIHAILGQEPPTAVSLAVAEQAESLGKTLFAIKAYAHAGAADKAIQLQALLNAKPTTEVLSE
jgi:hypothetical protein